MDYALADSSDEHTTATGSSLQSLPTEEPPRRLEKQPPLPRQVSPQLRKVASADEFGVSRACEFGTSAQSTTAPQQRVSAGNRLRGGVGQQLAWTGQQVPPKPQLGTLAASRSPMLSLSQGPLADLQRLVQAATPPDTLQGSTGNGAAAGRPQDQGMLTGVQDALAGVLSSLQQSVHTIQIQMQQRQQQTREQQQQQQQGNQQYVTQDEGRIEDSQSQISPPDRGSSVPANGNVTQQVCPPSNYRKHSLRRNSTGSQYAADLQDRSSLGKGSVSPRKQLPPSPPPEAPRTGYSSPHMPLRFSGLPAGHSNTHIPAESGTRSAVSATTAEPTLVATTSNIAPANHSRGSTCNEAAVRSPPNHSRVFTGSVPKMGAIVSSPTRMMPSRQSLLARPHAVWPAGGSLELNMSPARFQPAGSRTTWHPSSGFAPPGAGKSTPHR